ncbi:MAG: GTP-binding protein [Pseudomonadota bacterium]
MTIEARSRIPVTVLTGFLGSGKTTVLRHLSQSDGLSRTLVLVNEFGEVGLDHQLLTPIADDTLVAIDSGCICCTIRSDLAQTLAAAPARYARDGQRWFDRVVIETTGIADPAPILQTILGEAAVSRQYSLAGVVTTVDAVNGLSSIDAHPEALKQVAVADRILLTKEDLVEPDALDSLLCRIKEIAPSAPVSPVVHGAAEVDWFFAGEGYGLEGKHPDVESWLLAEGQRDDKDHHRHSHHSDGHDHNRHGRIQASCLTFTEPVDAALFEACLQSLLMFRGVDLLRIKGIINVEGMDKPMVIHGVQHVFHPPEILEQWPGDNRDTRIVIIARDLDHEALRECFAGLGLAAQANPV